MEEMKYEAQHDLVTLFEREIPRKEEYEERFQKEYCDSMEERRRVASNDKKKAGKI